VVSRQLLISLAAGLLFGAGLALSGMTDPGRVRAFLDVAGAWDPTLAFVMSGALAPMALAWRVQRRLERPIGAATFDLPQRSAIDAQLVGGAALFGVGWGASGLCPGPAIANLALQPTRAGLFVMAMLGGMALHRMASVPAVLRTA
jgi:uncharacterized membrane protein YedE/YeeE